MRRGGWLVVVLLVAGCRGGVSDQAALPKGRPYPVTPIPASTGWVERAAKPDAAVQLDPQRQAYFGDLHVHTTWSADAYVFGTTATPRDAYRYARGAALEHPAGFEMKLREPLDFYAVTDHALFLGLAAEAADTTSALSKYELAEPMHDLNADGNRGPMSFVKRLGLFRDFFEGVFTALVDGTLDLEEARIVERKAWNDIIDAAEEFNQPGEFTTFVGFEFTPSVPSGGSLHRNVIFRGSERLPDLPFSRYNSRDPEGLWDWLDGLRDAGIEGLAIPHNSNGSNGQMFALADWAGDPFDDDYTSKRVRNEPLVEITQIKGTSETHPSLSDNDEWADFEIRPFIGSNMRLSEPDGSYVRKALRDGLALADSGITNPYRMGFVAASDSHVGATSDDEANFFSKAGILDAMPELRGSVPLPWWQRWLISMVAPNFLAEVGDRNFADAPTRTFGASGLTGVWAEGNTRSAIYDAFRRRETFATSGTRIRVRFFAGDYDPTSVDDPSRIERAYANGVAMGGEIVGGVAPRFLAEAVRDPRSAPLQRLQVVKGWSESGSTFERVFDIACSGGAAVDPATARCPGNGATVDLSDCSISHSGAGELRAVWSDPQFDPSQRAFYYVRALEDPTCRWSTWDALRAGVAPREDLAATIQERAWSSPIWYRPQ